MSQDVNSLFQQYLLENADEKHINFTPLLETYPELKSELEIKIVAYQKLFPDEGKEQLIGKMIGDSEIMRLIARGGMSSVYLGYQEKLDRQVAIKIIHPNFSSTQTSIGRLRRESKNIAKLEHSNVLSIHDVGEQDGLCYVITPYIQGVPLNEIIDIYKKQKSKPTLDQIVQLLKSKNFSDPITIDQNFKNYDSFCIDVIKKIASALEYAHSKNIIHRDVKPSNILIKPNGDPVLIDFGLSRDFNEIGMTMTGEYMGTPVYSAPEQLFGKQEEVDERADVYSLGVTFFEMLTGELPYEGDTFLDVVTNIKAKISRKNTVSLPACYGDVILKAIEFDRNTRYTSINQFILDIHQASSLSNKAISDENQIKCPHCDEMISGGVNTCPFCCEEINNDQCDKTENLLSDDTDWIVPHEQPDLRHELDIPFQSSSIQYDRTTWIWVMFILIGIVVGTIYYKNYYSDDSIISNKTPVDDQRNKKDPPQQTLSNSQILKILYGNHDQTSSYSRHPVDQTVTIQIADQPYDLVTKGDEIITSILSTDEFTQGDDYKMYVLLKSLPSDGEIQSEMYAHAVSAAIGVAIFKYNSNQNEWVLETRSDYITFSPVGYGKTPDFQFKEIGPSKYGYIIKGGDGNMGEHHERFMILGQDRPNSSGSIIFEAKTLSYYMDIEEVEEYRYTADFTIDSQENDKMFYDIFIERAGYCRGKSLFKERSTLSYGTYGYFLLPEGSYIEKDMSSLCELKSQNESNTTENMSIIILKSTKNYDEAFEAADQLSKQMNLPLNHRELQKIPSDEGLTFVSEKCTNIGKRYPCYIPRGMKNDDGTYISVEFSSAYSNFTPGYYVVMMSNYHDKEKADSDLQVAKKFVADAYIKNSDIRSTDFSGSRVISVTGSSNTDFIFPHSSNKLLTDSEVRNLTADQLGIARNEIFARHGYIFGDGPKSKKYKDYFEGKSWYQPDNSYSGDISDVEKHNVDLIKKYENQFSTIDSSTTFVLSNADYIFPHSSTKLLTDDEVKNLSSDQLGIARNEIFARHGYVFGDGPNSKKYKDYFEGKSWYQPDNSYSGEIDNAEKYNVDLIKMYEGMSKDVGTAIIDSNNSDFTHSQNSIDSFNDSNPQEELNSDNEDVMLSYLSETPKKILNPWYAVENMTEKCIETEGPSHMIEVYQKLRIPYHVVDEKIDLGSPVVVSIFNDFESIKITFYKTAQLCQEAVSSKNLKNQKELNKYQ